MRKKVKLILIFSILFTKLIGQQVSVDYVNSIDSRSNLRTWDVLSYVITNNINKDLKSIISIQIVDNETGENVTLQSQPFNLKFGITYSQSLNGQANFYYVSSRSVSFAKILKPDFYFPSGQYDICISILNDEAINLTKACGNFEVLKNLDILLISPFDGEHIESTTPTFLWTMASINGQRTTYNVKWAESRDRIDATRAFAELPIFYASMNNRDNLLNYLSSFKKFDKSNYYYWQVEAVQNGKIVAVSDVWEFYFDLSIRKSNDFAYYDIDKSPNNKIYLLYSETGSFSFIFTNKYKQEEILYTITNQSNRDEVQGSFVLSQGRHKYDIDVSKLESNLYEIKFTGKSLDTKIRFNKI
jgi:hypothetical protein